MKGRHRPGKVLPKSTFTWLSFGKRHDKVPVPLIYQAEALSSLAFPLSEVHGSLCPPVVTQSSPFPYVSFCLALVLL